MSEPDNGPKSTEGSRDVEPQDDELIGEILEDLDLPPDKVEKVQEIIAMSYKGPVPPPAMLRQFEAIVPGAAKQIMDDAHLEHEHRREMQAKDLEHSHEMDRKGLNAAIGESRTGQILAFFLSVFVISLGAFLIYNDKSGWGFTLILLQLAGLAGAFLYNNLRQKTEPQQHEQNFPQEPQDVEGAQE